MRSILLLPLVGRCLETIDVCIWRMFVFIICCGCVVVRLSVHVHFNLGLSPRDSRVPGQRPSVCSIGLTVSV